MSKRIKRVVCVLALGLFGTALFAPPAQATDELCPYVRLFGARHEICIPLP